MSDRHGPHNGRSLDGRLNPTSEDVDDRLTDADGAANWRRDVRKAGAVEDTGPTAGMNAAHIGDLITENRDDVSRVANRGRSGKGGRS